MEELKRLSNELKLFLTKYDKRIILGHFTQLIETSSLGFAQDEVRMLSSPMRQLYYLAGLLVTTTKSGEEMNWTEEDWAYIVNHLNAIETEYFKIFLPKEETEITNEWKKKREVAIPSFLSYFNLGPLNFEEQSISWISDLYQKLDAIIETEIGLRTIDFLHFYDNLDRWCEDNLKSFPNPETSQIRSNWQEYTTLQIGVIDEAPEEIKTLGKSHFPMYTFVADYGIKNRFKASDLEDKDLPLDKVEKILSVLSFKVADSAFLYYTSTDNPLYRSPILNLEDGLYQVFEIKQVLHAIDAFLEELCCKLDKNRTKYVKEKGKLLENNIVNLFKSIFGKYIKCYTSYYVDKCEQDILILWKDKAFIIESKAYKINEPFRDPDRAYTRILQDFNRSIGYAYKQTWRVAEKFYQQVPLVIKDEHGNIIDTIDTTKYKDGDFSIIVTQKSFGQIQADLYSLLELQEGGSYPWAIKYDDLDVFLRTLKAMNKKPQFFIDFLIDREYLHGHVLCSDELQICGGYLTGEITSDICQGDNLVACSTDLASIFDEQYRKGLGFKNERHWVEKHDGRTLFI